MSRPNIYSSSDEIDCFSHSRSPMSAAAEGHSRSVSVRPCSRPYSCHTTFPSPPDLTGAAPGRAAPATPGVSRRVCASPHRASPFRHGSATARLGSLRHQPSSPRTLLGTAAARTDIHYQMHEALICGRNCQLGQATLSPTPSAGHWTTAAPPPLQTCAGDGRAQGGPARSAPPPRAAVLIAAQTP